MHDRRGVSCVDRPSLTCPYTYVSPKTQNRTYGSSHPTKLHSALGSPLPGAAARLAPLAEDDDQDSIRDTAGRSVFSPISSEKGKGKGNGAKGAKGKKGAAVTKGGNGGKGGKGGKGGRKRKGRGGMESSVRFEFEGDIYVRAYVVGLDRC